MCSVPIHRNLDQQKLQFVYCIQDVFKDVKHTSVINILVLFQIQTIFTTLFARQVEGDSKHWHGGVWPYTAVIKKFRRAVVRRHISRTMERDV